VFRYKSRKNPDINGFWICNFGRYSYSYINEDRLEKIISRNGGDTLTWETAIPYIAKKMRRLRDMDDAANITLILNTWLTNEELFLVKKLFVENFLIEKIFFVDPPQGQADEILLTSERTPNRRGAVEIGFDLKPLDWSQVSENTDMLLIFGSFLADQADSGEIKGHLDKIKHKFLLTPHSSDLNELMDVVLPTSVIPEKSGSITNVDGIVQELSSVLEGKGESQPEWKVLIDLAKLANADFGFKTLTSPAVILEEMSKEIAFFKKK